ncbi:MAG: murein L,D-transpeptidase catalytic domain family protein [Ferruginibacter sp.]
MRLYPSLAVLAVIALYWLVKIKTGKKTVDKPIKVAAVSAASTELQRLTQYANAAKLFARRNKFDTGYCFLVDMKLPCGSNRFFVFDMQQDAVLESGLVTHGYGKSSSSKINFSNIPGSNSTSLGRYKVGGAYMGKFGLAYKLHGLDSTNSNALNRFVVLHSHECVPSAEVTPQTICMSQGCPTVAPLFLSTLKTYIEKKERPVLLWIFY